jgi:hypothetical protein
MNSGIGDDDVQASQLGDAVIDRGGHGVEVTDFGKARRAASTPAFYFPCGIT